MINPQSNPQCSLLSSRHWRPALAVALCLTLGWSLPAQTVPNAPSAAPATKTASEAVVLDAFTVNTSRDVGFVAKESLAGGRINSDLRDTPASYSVLTKEFLEALNLSDMVEAQQWAPNVVATPDDGGDSMFGGTGISTVRGIAANASQKNFDSSAPSLQGGMNYDSFNLERLDFARGPNAILFGAGGMGGTTNAVGKQARLNHRSTRVGLETGSWYHKRVTFDHNQPLGRRVALRLNAVWQDGQGWQDYTYTKKYGFAPAVTTELTPTTRLTLATEYSESQSQQPFSYMTEAISAWDGVTTYTGQQTAEQRQFGGFLYTDKYYVFSPNLATNKVVNWGRMMRTGGASTSPTTVAGVAVPAGFASVSYEGTPFQWQTNRPANIFDRALAGARGLVIPSLEKPQFFDSVGNVQRLKNVALYLDQRIGRHLLLQLSANLTKRKSWGNVAEWANTSRVYIDINRVLPTGEPNPNLLVPYIEGTSLEQNQQLITSQSLRASLAYVRNFKWVDLKFNLIGANETNENEATKPLYVLPLSTDARRWGAVLSDTYKLNYRLYANSPTRELNTALGPVSVIDPITNTTREVTPRWVMNLGRPDSVQFRDQETQNLIAASTMSFFKKRLILLGASRWDTFERGIKYSRWAMDYPADYQDPMSVFHRPEAPEDYFKLTYQTKSTAGVVTNATPLPATTRPRTDGVPQAQYANDRFSDDFNPPRQKQSKPTTSLGGIVNLTEVFSVWASASQSFSPVDGNLTLLDYSIPPPAASKGLDYGLRLNLLQGRVVVNLSRYESTEKGVPFRNNATPHMNNISNVNVLGDNSTGGRNNRGMQPVPTDYYDTRDYRAEGYELEIVGNLTSNWRLTANGSLADAKQENAYAELRRFVATHDTLMRQILADAGVTIDSNDFATVTTLGSPDGNSGANAWNTLQNFLRNVVSGSQHVNRSTPYTVNLFTDYRVSREKLKGLRLGLGMQFRGPQVIGYRGADTIVDPANAARAIDDPARDAYTVMRAKSYYTGVATVGYPVKVLGQRIDLNLSISNLFNYRDVQYIGTTMRPPEGNVLSPARLATPHTFSIIAPRGFKLAARYSF
jgi:outer membrane receptor for ferric coprogen and ferric-rhodotorulic acid